MKTKTALILHLLTIRIGFSQGFVNLDFEGAEITGNLNGHEIQATNAFPCWTVSAGLVYYNDFSLSGGSISIIDTNSMMSYSPPQGNYYAFIFAANYAPDLYSISIGQTGQIPVSAQSVTFWGTLGGMQATFNGQPIDFLVTGSTANYTIYSADISAYAGQTGQLLFTLPPNVDGDYAILDNIQFSTTAVPEPGPFALAALGTLLLGFRRWRSA